MEATQEIMHENCRLDHRYVLEMGGQKYQATFKGYLDNNQYRPTFEIVGQAGEFRIIREID